MYIWDIGLNLYILINDKPVNAHLPQKGSRSV